MSTPAPTATENHVDQIRTWPDGDTNGANDCWEACLASFLRANAYPDLPAADLDLIGQIAQVARGRPDQEYQDGTTLPEAEASLRHYRVGYRWTADYQQALAAKDSICLVDGTLLAPPQYPASWFGAESGQANHFIRWLPARNGDPSWFMDPLALSDCQYTLSSVQRAFYGAYILTAALAHTVRAACALKAQPNHTCIALAHLLPGQPIEPTGRFAYSIPGPHGKEDWEQITALGKTGFVPASNVA